MHINSIKISVIIPFYNSHESINDTINSVLKQNGKNFFYEIIVIDDCSKLDLDFTILKHSPYGVNYTIQILRNEINLGVGLTRTRGINIATGEFIAFLDSDDSWSENKSILQISFLQENTEFGLVGSLTNMPSSAVPFYKKNNKYFYKINLFDLMFKWYLQPSTVIIRKHFIDKIDEDIYRYGGEGWYYIQLTNFTKLALLNIILVDYDNGKRGFGQKGLTAKIHYMEKCELRNYYFGLIRGNLNFIYFLFATTFSLLKYTRRLIICKVDEYRNE